MIGIRLLSQEYDFSKIAISEYPSICTRKGESIRTGSKFKATQNVIFIKDICKMEEVAFDSSVLIERLLSLFDQLSCIPESNVRRELYISGSINTQQFGFELPSDLLQVLSRYGYSLCFSGISYLDDSQEKIVNDSN